MSVQSRRASWRGFKSFYQCFTDPAYDGKEVYVATFRSERSNV